MKTKAIADRLSRFTVLYKIIMVLTGAALFALAIQWFMIPSRLTEGGITGTVLLLHYLFGFKPFLTMFLMNIPIFIWGWWALGIREIGYSVIGALGFSAFLWLFEWMEQQGTMVPLLKDDDLLAVLCAGLVSGLGLGLVLRHGGSTGGSNLLAQIFQVLYGWHASKTILWFDVVVIGAAIFYIPIDRVLYTLIMVYITARVIHVVNKEQSQAKDITVYSSSAASWASRILASKDYVLYQAMHEPNRHDIQVVRCLVANSEWHRLKKEIHAVDPQATLIANDVFDFKASTNRNS